MSGENLNSFVNEILDIDPAEQLSKTYNQSRNAVYSYMIESLREHSPPDLGNGILGDGIQINYQEPLPSEDDSEEERSEAYLKRHSLRTAVANMQSAVESAQEMYKNEAKKRGINPSLFESEEVIRNILEYAPVYREAQDKMEEVKEDIKEAYKPVSEAIARANN